MTNEEHLEENLEANVTSEETQNEKYSEGDTVSGKVSKIEEKFVEVTLEDGVIGIVPISQLTSKRIETTDEAASLDQNVTAKVIKVEDNTTLILSIRQYDNEAAYKALESQKNNDETISATVIEVVPAGLVVDVGVRGFIPASLISTEYVENLSQFDGQTLEVKIEDVDEENNRVILNRRKLEEKSQHEERLEVLEDLHIGDIVKGQVVRTTNFGAFINVNGVDGLAHISELSYERVEKVEDAVTIGETVDVKVLNVDPESERISLSVKQAGESPFQKFFNEHQVGDSVKGTVKRLVDFGAFVEVAAGVEGLVHVSEISHDHVGHPEDELKPEQEIDVKIIGFDPDKEKTSLSIKALTEKPKNDNKNKNTTVYTDSDEESLTLGDILGDKLKKLDL